MKVCGDSLDLAGGWVAWLTKGKRTWLNGRYVSVSWDVTELENMKDEIESKDKLKLKMAV